MRSIAIPSRATEGILAKAAPLVLAAALTGCGTASVGSSSSSGELVARIGGTAIDRGEVDHWARAIERGSSVGTALGKISGAPREKALEFLISSGWILGEAQERGLSISSGAVERGLREKIAAAPNGRSEFEEEIAWTRQKLADVKLEVRSVLAAAKLRDAAAERAPAATGAEVMSYYAHHRQSFYLPERRVVYLLEGIRGYTHALALASKVRPGTRLSRPWFREIVSKTPGTGDREKLVHMIYATAQGRVTRPAMFNGGWVLAVARKLIPAGIQPLTLVRGEVSKAVAAQHRERALRRFADAFARKWSARTSCSPAYVIQKCAQYRGTLTQENPLTGK
jgi:hypothetical protein